MKKRILSIVLTLCMVLMFVPQTVFAEGETSSTPSVTAYATKDQLMTAFTPDSNGTATYYGKLVFGKQSDGTTAQEWYILGKDTGVSGDNTIIFAASPIVPESTGQVFNSDTSDKTYDSTTVNANHYGASDLRVALQNMATNTSYFTTAEQGLMNATTVTTNDTKNSVTYTTTDKLYALQGDYYNDKYLWAGTSDNTVLAMSSYWSDTSGDWFWLRSPTVDDVNHALLAAPGSCVSSSHVINGNAVQPASNLNLSSVLFASAATAASSDTKSEKITDGTAMTLRLDGTGKNIGTVTYNTTTGDIKAVKGSTSQTVVLVVQGNDGTNDWYYSKQITGTAVVNASDIKSALSLTSDIDLSTCKIWLEITDSTENLTYAVNATEEIVSITSVVITGIDTPAANTALDTEASCATTGVSSTTPQITWTPGDTTAGYNTSYTASITLTAATGYEFTDSTTATVMGNAATSVNKNPDGTLTVTYAFPEILDTIDPVISGVEDGKTYCSAQTVTVSDNDAIEKVTVNRTEVTLDEYNQFTLSPASGTQEIIATDNAGNSKTVTVTVNNGHTYEWQNENGQYWQKCKYCDDETAKKDIPTFTIDAPDTVCRTQDCEVSVTLPDSISDAALTFEFIGLGGAVDTTIENGMLSSTIKSSSYPNNENSFKLIVYATTDDGFSYKVSKTVEIQNEHAGGVATCTELAICDTCGEHYGELDSSNHNLERISAKPATVTEVGNTEYWHCLDCDKYFADENGENEIELTDTVIAKLPPEIIEGEGQSIVAGEKKELTFKSNAAYSDFIRVELDGKTLDEKNYTVKEGSTVVTLKADYVASLSVGEHTIGIVSESGTATTTFTVNAKTVVDDDTKSPQTGDNSHMALWIALLFVSGAGIIGTTVYGKKKKRSVR